MGGPLPYIQYLYLCSLHYNTCFNYVNALQILNKTYSYPKTVDILQLIQLSKSCTLMTLHYPTL